MKHIRLTRHVLIGSVVVALLAGSSSALALAADQQPASNVYQGCLSHTIGTVYNVYLNPSTAPKCFSHDTQISWNQTGPPVRPARAAYPAPRATPAQPERPARKVPKVTLGRSARPD